MRVQQKLETCHHSQCSEMSKNATELTTESSSSSSSRNVPHVNRQAGRHPMGVEDGAAFPLATANPPATQPQETEQRQPHIKLSNLCVHSPQCMPAVCIRHSIRSCLNIYQTFSVFSNLKSLPFSNLKTFFCLS